VPATSKKNDAAMMAWYRAKKFGVTRPHFEGNIPTFAGATGLSADGANHGQRPSRRGEPPYSIALH
jgi:hypothetical protein